VSPPRLVPALLGGTFTGVLTALPIVGAANCCCLWLVSGGMLAAWLTQQNHPAPITIADGAIAGWLSSIVGAVVYAIVGSMVMAALGPMVADVTDRLLRTSRDLPPEVADLVRELWSGPAGVVAGATFWLLLGMIFSTLGGVLGAALFRRAASPPPSSPAPPPPPVMTPPPPLDGI